MDINAAIGDDLLSHEKILWSGQPTLKLFTTADLFLVPFSILWGGFAIFWESMVVTANAPLFASLWGLPFVLVGLYMIFGRFMYKRYKKARTYYVVTNQRVLVLTNLRHKQITAAFINQVPAINKTTSSSGIGNITFGGSNMMMAYYNNTGMDFMVGAYGNQLTPAFYDVADVDSVYKQIMDARKP